MSGKIVLLTGLSGSGKTTLANELKKIIAPLEIIGIGKYILEVKQQERSTLEYWELYHNPTKTISEVDLKTVYQRLIQDSNRLIQTTNLILDGHAVTIDHYGFFVRPASREFLTRIPLSAVILLQLTPRVLLKRLK